MNKSVDLLKNGGFYSVFGDSCYIMLYLFGYKIIDNRVGFPKSVYDKVVNKLDELCINYNDPIEGVNKDFKKKNKYSEFVAKGKNKYSITTRINGIIDRLSNLSENELDSILSYIEDKLGNE